MTQDWQRRVPRDAHWLIVGGTRRGKSGLLQLVTRAFLAAFADGITVLDPHGSFARAILEWLANPANRQTRRRVHLIDAGSGHVVGLNPLRVEDPLSWTQCHDAANTLASVIESRFEASAEQTPRLSRIIYVAGMLCARHTLTLVEMLEVLSLGGEQLRQSLLSDFDNTVVRAELEDLHELAQRQPARFLETVESAKNRLVRWLGDRRLARMLGQKRGLDPRAVMDGRDVVLFDGSSLSYSDAAFVGTIITSMFFTSARYRPPLRAPFHRLIIDEAESLLTADVARLCDQSAKMGLLLIAAIQRLGQVRARGDFIADALLVNCAVKIIFGGLEAESARYMAENLFSGHLNLAEWKPGSERPVVVGHRREMMRSRAISRSEATHAAESESESVARGYARSRTRAVSEGHAEGVSDGYSEATSIGSAHTESAGVSASLFESAGTSQTLTPPPVDEPLFMPVPEPVVLSVGESLGTGSGLTSSSSWSSGQSSSHVSGSSHARSSSRSRAISEAEGESHSEMHGSARGRMRGTSHGTSETQGESEGLVPVMEWLPSQAYSLEEQLHRTAATLMGLPRRECIVKIEGEAPLHVRTADLSPAFRSPFFRRVMLPRFVASVAARSRYMVPAADADAAIAARRDERQASPEADFSPEPMPIIDDPETFAARFWAKRGKPSLRIVKQDGDSDR